MFKINRSKILTFLAKGILNANTHVHSTRIPKIILKVSMRLDRDSIGQYLQHHLTLRRHAKATRSRDLLKDSKYLSFNKINFEF